MTYTTASSVTLAGATIENTGGNVDASVNVALIASSQITSTSAANTFTLQGVVSVASNVLTLSGSGNITLDGEIDTSAGGSIYDQATGSVTLNGPSC